MDGGLSTQQLARQAGVPARRRNRAEGATAPAAPPPCTCRERATCKRRERATCKRTWCTARPHRSQQTSWSKSKSLSRSHTQQRSPLYRTLMGWKEPANTQRGAREGASARRWAARQRRRRGPGWAQVGMPCAAGQCVQRRTPLHVQPGLALVSLAAAAARRSRGAVHGSSSRHTLGVHASLLVRLACEKGCGAALAPAWAGVRVLWDIGTSESTQELPHHGTLPSAAPTWLGLHPTMPQAPAPSCRRCPPLLRALLLLPLLLLPLALLQRSHCKQQAALVLSASVLVWCCRHAAPCM